MKHKLTSLLMPVLLALAVATIGLLSGCNAAKVITDRAVAAGEEAIEGVDETSRKKNALLKQAGGNQVDRAGETLEGVSDLQDDAAETTHDHSDRLLESAHESITRQGERTTKQLQFQCKDLQPGAEVTITGTDIRTICPVPPPPPDE